MSKFTYDDLITKIENKYELTVTAGKKLFDRQMSLSDKESYENLSQSINFVFKNIMEA